MIKILKITPTEAFRRIDRGAISLFIIGKIKILSSISDRRFTRHFFKRL
jgi:hypothetical protein